MPSYYVLVCYSYSVKTTYVTILHVILCKYQLCSLKGLNPGRWCTILTPAIAYVILPQ